MAKPQKDLGLGEEALKEVGLGQPPEVFGPGGADQVIADQCAPDARITKSEVARWRVDIPITDAQVNATFGTRFSPWSSPDGQPPPGVTTATNTLATPAVPSGNIVIRGIEIRVLVTPESRRIPINFFDPLGVANMPGSPDDFTVNDAARALGLSGAQQAPIKGDVLYGQPTWKAAYAFMNAYELVVSSDHQEALIRQPLTSVATIEPFAEAEAAGNSFTMNQEVLLALNTRLLSLGITAQAMPVLFKRLGSETDAVPANFGVFTVSREEDAAIAMFGGIGVSQVPEKRWPFLFSKPWFWPRGQTLNIQFEVNDNRYQAEFQRWLSVTGGSGGTPGSDLRMPFSSVAALQGNMPTTATGDVMVEQTLDTTPANVNQQTDTYRALLKLGPMVFEISLVALRMRNIAWNKPIANAIQSGALVAPMGAGEIAYLLQQ